MPHSDQKHSFLLHRVFQYVAVIGILAVLGGGYWYWKNARAAVQTTDNRPSFEAPLTHDLNLTRGQGIATYSRADGADRRATVTDFAGLIRPVKQNEARFEGARRVENLFSRSESFDISPWSGGATITTANAGEAPDGTTSAEKLTFSDAANQYVNQSVSWTENTTYVFSIWIKGAAGKKVRITLQTSGGAGSSGDYAYQQVTLNGTWQRFSSKRSTGTGHSSVTAGLYNWTGDNGGSFDVYAWGAQFEDVTGQANQNPSEYVSVGVKTASPYHGAGVDGVKYFDTQNDNTVASNVVTEATGAAISTSTLKGYLAEGARTNLATYSEQFDNAAWSKTAVTASANQAVSPDGRTSAEKVTPDVSSGYHLVNRGATTTSGSSYTMTIYAKPAGYNWIYINLTDPGNHFAIFDVSSGAVGGTSSITSSNIRSVGNGWYRCEVVATLNSVSPAINIHVTGGNNTASFSGDGTSGVYFWGAQFEQAPFASSYIPTTSAAVTRAADSLSYPLSGNSNDTKGTFLATVTPNWTNETAADAFFIANSSHTRRVSIWHWAGNTKMLVADRSANSTVTRNTSSDVSQDLSEGVAMNLAMKYDDSYVKLFRDGSLRGTDSTLTLPYDSLINDLYIGRGTNSATHSFSNVKSVRAWKKALTDAELNGLTSLTQSTSDSAVKETIVKSPDNTGLVAYWSFEDGSGTKAEDFSPSGSNTGTLTNGPTWTDGKIGKAVAFDGTDDYINVPNAGNLNPGTENFTISAWIRVDSAPTDYRRLISKGAGSNYYAFVKFPGDKWKFEFRDGTLSTGDLDFGASTMTYGNWTHLVATIDRGNSLTSGYLDGVLKDTSSIAGYTSVSNTDYLSLGRSSIGAPYAIDDVRIYDRVLSATEIAEIYRTASSAKLNTSQNSQLTSGLVGLWSFNGSDVSGTTAYDRSGQANNGTLTNGPTPTIGKVGQALNFNGTSSYVNVGNPATYNITGSITVSTWIKMNSFKSSGSALSDPIIGKWAYPSTGYDLRFFNGNTSPMFVIADGAGYDSIQSSTSVSIGTWTHIVGIWSSGGSNNFQIYVNGTVTQKTNAYSSLGVSPNALHIGHNFVNAAYLDGSMDEVRIYNRALSATEVTALYNAGR